MEFRNRSGRSFKIHDTCNLSHRDYVNISSQRDVNGGVAWTKDIHIFVQFVRPSVGLLCGRVSNVD